MSLVIFLMGMLSGVALRSILFLPQVFFLAFILASLISFMMFRKYAFLNLLFIFLLASGIGMIWFSYSEHQFELKKDNFENEKVFQGIIDEIPVVNESNISARTKIDQGYVLLRFDKRLEEKNEVDHLEYGNKLFVTAQCELPETFETDSGTTFDYPHYLMARSMHHVCKVISFELLERNSGNYIQAKLYQLRLWFSGHIDQAFNSPHSGLIKGVLLGDKSGLSSDLKKDMTTAGVIHIAVLSGSNIAMVATIIFGFSKSFPYRMRILLTVIIIILFVLLSGAEPPAVRAGILVLIIFLGKFLHRKPHTGRALLVIAFLMVAYNPFALIYDMSFQLSFLATLGIVYVAPWLEKKFTNWRIPERFGLREVLAGTMGAQLTVTPLLIKATGTISLVSLPANVLIGWAVPVLMSLGFFGGMLHVISGFLAMPIVFLGELISKYIIGITQLAAHLNF